MLFNTGRVGGNERSPSMAMCYIAHYINYFCLQQHRRTLSRCVYVASLHTVRHIPTKFLNTFFTDSCPLL